MSFIVLWLLFTCAFLWYLKSLQLEVSYSRLLLLTKQNANKAYTTLYKIAKRPLDLSHSKSFKVSQFVLLGIQEENKDSHKMQFLAEALTLGHLGSLVVLPAHHILLQHPCQPRAALLETLQPAGQGRSGQ